MELRPCRRKHCNAMIIIIHTKMRDLLAVIADLMCETIVIYMYNVYWWRVIDVNTKSSVRLKSERQMTTDWNQSTQSELRPVKLVQSSMSSSMFQRDFCGFFFHLFFLSFSHICISESRWKQIQTSTDRITRKMEIRAI